jgi:hypothetical protein
MQEKEKVNHVKDSRMHKATRKETLGMREKEVQHPSTGITSSEEASHKVQIEKGMTKVNEWER